MMLLENPDIRFPVMKMAMARDIAAFLPKISLNRPYSGWNAVDVKRYADGTQDTTEPALKTEDIVGMAVATITESRAETTTHRDSPRNTTTIFLKGRRFVWSVNCTDSLLLKAGVPTVGVPSGRVVSVVVAVSPASAAGKVVIFASGMKRGYRSRLSLDRFE